jgi:hypothetical protein
LISLVYLVMKITPEISVLISGVISHLVKMEVSKKEKKYGCYTTEKASERICQELD